MHEMTISDQLANIDKMSTDDIRSLIAQMENQVGSGEQIEVPLEHHFSKGVYAREMRLPAGSLIVGKIHKHQNLNILSQGEVSVFSVDGVMRVKAPFTLVASPGAKRVILAHTDVVWTTIHGTHETDLEKIENEFIAKTYDEVIPLGNKEKLCLG